MNYREKTEKIVINKFKSIKKGLSTFVERPSSLWALTDSNRRPSACKADAELSALTFRKRLQRYDYFSVPPNFSATFFDFSSKKCIFWYFSMVLGVKAARFCVFTAKNSQLRESTHDGLQSTFRQEKKLIEEEKNVFKEF